MVLRGGGCFETAIRLTAGLQGGRTRQIRALGVAVTCPF
jgi:hypothetical protein